MSIFQALLIGILYYISDSPWPFGEGYYVLQRPLVAGFLAGLVLGKPVEGTIIGATMNLIYLGHITVGGTMPGDMALAGYLGTALALSSNIDVNQALAIAVPLGIMGTIVWHTKMSVNSVFCHWIDKEVADGNIGKAEILSWFPAQLLLVIIKIPAIFIAAYFGSSIVSNVLNMISPTLQHGLSVAGGLLPALGIALNLRSILKTSTLPYLVAGFALVAYLKLDIIGVAVFGLVVAVISQQNNSTKEA
ncbi:PTS sugar transporter subunit IIC [Solobacterium moorei]|uniref:PTS mannose/fructose/sorbose/N-acetylgalactosamine transporter subunit IIC n=1 Tax=Solobacterium moorei TaxID=102148 RepID=UPI0023F3B7EB|nr:PTS sugar transporter subunit IIC [Solobacterium moorei]